MHRFIRALRLLAEAAYVSTSAPHVLHKRHRPRSDLQKRVNENGSTHYGQLPPQQCSANGTVESIALSQRYAPSRGDSSAQPQVANRTASGISASGVQAAEEATVKLFTTNWRGHCKKDRAFLGPRGVRFVQFDIEKDPVTVRRKKLIDNRPGIPLAPVNGQPVHRFALNANTQAPP